MKVILLSATKIISLGMILLAYRELSSFGVGYLAIFLYSFMLASLVTGVLDVGMSKVIARLIIESKNYSNTVVRTINTYYLLFAALLAPLAFFFGDDLIMWWLNQDIAEESYNELCLLLPSFSIISLIFAPAFVAVGQFRFQLLYHLSNGVVSYAPFVLSLFGGLGPEKCILILVGSRAAHFLLVSLLLRKAGAGRILVPSLSRGAFVQIKKILGRYPQATLLTSVSKTLDRLFVSTFASTEFYVFYDIAIQIFQRSAIIVTSFTDLSFKSTVVESIKSSRNSIKKRCGVLMLKARNYIFLAMGLIAPVIYFANTFVMGHVGGYLEYLLILFLSVAVYYNWKLRVFVSVFIGHGQDNIYFIMAALTASLGLLFTIFSWILGYELMVAYVLIVNVIPYKFVSNELRKY